MDIGRISITLILAVSSFSQVAPAWAEELYPDNFRLAIGSYTVDRSDATLSLTDSEHGAGIALDPRDTFGLDLDSTVLRVEGYYRFNERHALSFAWFNLDSSGNKLLEDSIDWVDRDGNEIVIPVGARVDSNMDVETLKVGYLWSFYNSDKVEVAVGGGLHVSRLTIDIDASVTLPPDRSMEQVDTALPLPVLSSAFRYRVTPRFHWDLKAEVFALEFDRWYGSYIDVTLGVEYRAWKHLAIGGGLSRTGLEIEEDDSDYYLKYENRQTGAQVYLATYF